VGGDGKTKKRQKFATSTRRKKKPTKWAKRKGELEREGRKGVQGV